MADMTVAVALVGEDKASKPIKDVTTSLKGMEQQAEHTGGVLGSLTGALGKVGLAGLGLKTAFDAVSGAVGLLTGPIQAASDLSESMNKVDVVFGSSAKIVQDFAKTSAQNLGQSQAAALEAAGGFGNLFVSMGLGQKQAASLSTDIVTLGSDLASFNNIKPEEALEKLRAGLVGEAEPLRALGVNINEASVAEEALRLGLGKSAKELTESAKIQARYSLILKQTKTAQGDFARTSTGMANATRIISASLADLQTEIGNRLLPVVAPLVAQFAKFLPAAMDYVRPYLDRAGAAIQGVADAIGRIVTSIREQGVIATLKQLGSEIGPALLDGLRAAQGFAGDVVAWLKQQVAAIDWRGIWSSAVNVGQGLVARLGTITGDVVAWLRTQWAAIDWGAVWKSVTGLASGLATGLATIASTVTEWVKAQWAAVDWDAVWKSVKGHGAALVANLAPISDDLTKWMSVQWGDVSWGPMLAQAKAERDMKMAWANALDQADTGPAANAVADWLKRGFNTGVDQMTGQPATFDRATALTLAAWGQSMDRGDLGLIFSATKFGFRVVNQIALAVVGAPNWDTARLQLQAKLEQMVTGIFPIKVGPLTIGLQGVSLDLSGIGRGTATAGDPNANPSAGPGLTRDPGTRDVYSNARGGLYRVAGGGGTDSQMVRFRASPGEVVAVGHPRRGGGAVVVNQTFNVANRADAEYLADVLPDALARALEKARSQQGPVVVSGLTRFN